MIVTRTGENTVDIQAETEDDQLIITQIKTLENRAAAEINSLHRQLRILADDNKYLKFMLDKNNVVYDKDKTDG